MSMKLSKRTVSALRRALDQKKASDAASFTETHHIVLQLCIEGGDFGALEVDPFTIPDEEWNAAHPVISRGFTALVKMDALLLFQYETPDSLCEAVTDLVRDIWYPLMTWMEFANPASGYISLDAPLFRAVLSLFHHFFAPKFNALSSLVMQTPRLYAWSAWLWLCLPQVLTLGGRTPAEDSATLHHYIICTEILNQVITTMLREYHIGGGGHQRYNDNAVREALGVVDHRFRRMLRAAIDSMSYLIDAVQNSPTAPQQALETALEETRAKLSLLSTFATALGDVEVHSRDIVALVHLIRTLHDIPEGQDAVSAAADLLRNVCVLSEDHRPLVWSLKAGLFPLLVSICRLQVDRQQDTSSTYALLWHIAIWTTHFPVAVAFQKYRGDGTFGMSRAANSARCTELDEEMNRRCDLVQEIRTLRCHNYRCATRDAQDQAEEQHFLRCGCYDVSYCSKACQKQHWLLHRLTCSVAIDRKICNEFGNHLPKIIRDGSYATPRNAYFVARLCKDYIRRHGDEILAAIRQADRPDIHSHREMTIDISFVNEVPASYSVRHFPKTPGECESCNNRLKGMSIFVYATLNPTRLCPEGPWIGVTSFLLREFVDRVEHFRSCKDHATCVARTRDFPPRCGAWLKEESDEQCCRCIDMFGKGDNQLDAATADELKFGKW